MVSESTHCMNTTVESVPKLIKCVVWDLDNTIWDGTLLEDERVVVRQSVVEVIEGLDRRGILQSLASKNDFEQAMRKLSDFGLSEYFLYPQIGWGSKANSISEISKALNIGLEAMAFVDDQEVELAEVRFSYPAVLVLAASCIPGMLNLPEMTPSHITEDAANRRRMYVSDMARKQAEASFAGPQEAFLESLEMTLTVSRAVEEDLARAEELTLRTHQLNTTGYTYSCAKMREFVRSKSHLLLLASLDDRYGSYGKIGLVLIECGNKVWTIKLMLLSCRVMSRGLGSVLIAHIAGLAKAEDVALHAEFVANERNRVMYITYRLNGFREVERVGDRFLLRHDLSNIPHFPSYLKVEIERSSPDQ